MLEFNNDDNEKQTTKDILITTPEVLSQLRNSENFNLPVLALIVD